MNKKLGNIMLDLETLGKRSYSAIISIGAVEFDIKTGKTGREFYEIVDLQSCLDSGLKVEASTVYFWLQQSQAARNEICKPNAKHLAHVLQLFNDYLGEYSGTEFGLWGNGSKFDIGLLENAHDVCNLKYPWHYRSEKDVRTLVSFAPKIKEMMPFEGVEHNPIADCKHQIKYCTAIWNKLNF